MPNQTTVTLVNGVPTAPSGTVSTIDALMADGGQATLGAKADATWDGASAASGVSLWRYVGTKLEAVRALLAGTLTVASHAVTNAGTFAVQAAVTPGASETKVTAATIGTGGVGYIGWLSTIAQALAGTLTVATHAVTQSGSWVLSAGAALIGKVGIDQTTDGTTNKVAANIRHSDGTVITDATGMKISTSQLATLSTTSQAMSAGYQLVGLPTDLTWPKGLSNRVFVAAFSTLTRPANTTAYTAFDSISDNATAGSVTALSATVSDVNDDPIFINEIVINSTDTGLAGKRIRAYLYNSDPTASTGVGGGDNAAFANKKAGYIGSFSGKLETGFSDGTVGRLVPTFNNTSDTTDYGGQPAGGFITVKPTSGAKTLFIQFQAIDGFTPSANSTTIIASARGWQGRAA